MRTKIKPITICHEWKVDEIELMKRQMRFNDRLNNNQYSKERGRLNRRVEIRLIDAGECSGKL